MVMNDGKSKGCGVVSFSTADEATNAVRNLNDVEIEGRKILVRYDRDPKVMRVAQHRQKEYVTNQIRAKAPPGGQLFVTNLPYRTTWIQLKELCSQYGTVLRADTLIDRDGRSKGCGTVLFENEEEAKLCIEALNESEYEGRVLGVKVDEHASKFQNLEPGSQIYVGNLPYTARWFDLKDLFSQFGEVVRADVAFDSKYSRSKGFGTVRFKTAEEAAAAMSLHDSDYNGRPLIVRLDNKV